MPSRRNGRKQQQESTHIQQQPTPSSRPSPSIYPSPLPESDDSDSIQQPRDPDVSYRHSLLDDDSPLVSFDNNNLVDEAVEEFPSGHQRSPILSRDPTPLESLSRTVRSSIHTVRSSIPIPTAAPSPPTVSRPVSFGSFLTGQPGEDGGGTIRGPRHSAVIDDSTSFDHPMPSGLSQAVLSYPQNPDGTDTILWARWDYSHRRRLLFLGYRVGLQVWDCTDLGCVSEVLNIGATAGEGLEGTVVFAGVISPPRRQPDHFQGYRPLIGVLHNIASSSLFSVYSLSGHRVLKQMRIPGPDGVLAGQFAVGDDWLVISTSRPAALHVFSSATFDLLHTIPAADLLAFSHLSTSFSSNDNTINTNNVSIESSTQHLERDLDNSDIHSLQRHLSFSSRSGVQWPVFALRGRLLAHASPPPKPSDGGVQDSGEIGLHLSRKEVGAAAMKVGGSVLSGIKTLGGMAYRYGVKIGSEYVDGNKGPANTSPTGVSPASTGGATGLVNAGVNGVSKFFSKSAPAATTTASERNRRYSTGGQLEPGLAELTVAPRTAPSVQSGYYVRILDLTSLGHQPTSSPKHSNLRVVTEFMASKSQPISNISWSADGSTLLVVPKDGQVAKTFQIKPVPRPVGALGALNSMDKSMSNVQDALWHMYSLRRGRTSAVVEEIGWAEDGRWIAIGTKKRTVHVFPVNPYGGKPDGRSHIQGRVSGPSELPLVGIEVSPLVRLRASRAPTTDRLRVPLAFTFLEPPSAITANNSLPSNLLPPATSPSLGASPVPGFASSSPSTRSDPPLSPHQLKRPTNYQDILVFDPADGMLSLRRITTELRPTGEGSASGTLGIGMSAVSAALNAGATSISLPNARLSISSSSSPTPGSGLHAQMTGVSSRSSGLSQMMDGNIELVGRDSNIATWNLQRRMDWAELKRPIVEQERLEGPVGQAKKTEKDDWLAQAELSTFSKCTRVLPRPIYLSHQFSFHNLGEDYHALIRGYQFDFSGPKIEVRKEVEVSAYADSLGGRSGESFVEGYSIPRDRIRRSSSSFDEPLASAIGGDLEYTLPQPVLPMLPNGTPGKGNRLFTSSIPIRNKMAGLGDGMSEGLGRFRREMHSRKMKSPSFGPRSGDSALSESVPLEFDEEDEEFMINREDSQTRGQKDSEDNSRTTSIEPSVSTPETSTQALGEEMVRHMNDEGSDVWHRWGEEEHQVLEEAEKFDHISAVGFMDEEQEQERATLEAKAPEKKERGRKKKPRDSS